MAPTTPTTPQFPRLDPPTPSRSPSRSPRRRAQFAIRELDPLLGNLTPGSTLRALQATETISGGAAQEDALTTSIADATPAEREIGIRAAFAAQKLREWKNELSQWTWPGKKERGFGLGFVPPSNTSGKPEEYRGCLPASVAEDYEARIEEIRDDLDSMGIDEIKDHVLEAHLPATSPTKASRSVGPRSSYGRMRDFTALITATVIQALPDLAKLNMLLDTWDVRLRVLRDLARFLDVMQSTKSEIQQAFDEIRTPDSAQALTRSSLDDKKMALGGRVSDLGRRIDRFLDMLEGREDSLPQAWIDVLEKIELDYATWAVEADHVVLRNNLASKSSRNTGTENIAGSPEHPESLREEIVRQELGGQAEAAQPSTITGALPENMVLDISPSDQEEVRAKRRPSLKLDLANQKGHKREVSKVSVADSTYSTFSDISNAEIMDARTTSVLPSPKISVVENPFPTSRDEIAWFGSPSAAQQQMALKPPMLQRASTASIEVFPKDKLKQVVLRRAASWDILTQIAESPESTPSKALKQLTAATGSTVAAPSAEVDVHQPSSPPSANSTARHPVVSPSLQVDSVDMHSRQEPPLPVLPRRSSKRNSTIDSSPITPVASRGNEESVGGGRFDTLSAEVGQSPRRPKTRESLDDRIQDILTSLPTRIRLAKDADAQSSSNSSTRASTPTASLTLSPAKADPSSRRGSLADPDIKLYHLTRSGQGREAPPVKLFVRTVGDGDRVMVRVGGGWADLGEYLREYSLHHGSRATVDGRLEVASFPGNGPRDSVSSASGASASQGRRKSRSPTVAQTTFEGTTSAELVNPKTRSSTQRHRSPERRKSRGDGAWTTPPVPPIPPSYTVSPPTLATSTNHETGTVASIIDPATVLSKDQFQQPRQSPVTASLPRYSTVTSPGGVTTTTVVTPPTTTTNYTPLGAAGPKMNVRRAATYATTPAASNDAWVQGMVGKARAVSGGGSSTIVQGPNGTTTTTTTTTTFTSTPPSTGRRASSYFGSSPSSNVNSSPVTISTSPSTSSIASDAKISRRTSLAARPKGSRMSLGDIGGIKRVFLRKKSEGAK
ncbi:uncharacterized protein Z520_09986 [Fonsecaea multimorphosa CBS 102226]|uniref:GAR domain-containing protein n=1 Tax=Fonsecaea multimorphosa CBS 102226 TaxID=1442371 RepID=A0A0D2IAU4_9EURO|nr:uncharacterized protein Z520_09986 [Fonsecaea multimorphosa CBS 102226]KIX94276.1 hypothetical protein Z520_09986 [Fonsecaea multimorphosa CBS 102226]OAL19956.1 hypothetical protein AYO22_09483 [Fonsecaea multimorphosa]